MWRNCQPALLRTPGRLNLPTMNCLIKSLYHCLFNLSPIPPAYQVFRAAWPPLCAPYISNAFLTFFLANCQVNENSLFMFLEHVGAPHLKCSFKADTCKRQYRSCYSKNHVKPGWASGIQWHRQSSSRLWCWPVASPVPSFPHLGVPQPQAPFAKP